MTVPVTDEAKWLGMLSSVPRWHPPERPTVVLVPHPDDETLGAGGFIAAQRRRGIPVRIVAATDGEAAYGYDTELGKLRCLEQERALGELGVDAADIVRLQLPDSGVTAREAELAERLLPMVGSGTLLMAPWRFDRHPDHEACGRAAELVAGKTGAMLVSYFFWSWHHADLHTIAGLPLVRFELDKHLEKARAAALSQHRSQLLHANGREILPPLLLLPAQRGFETFVVHA